MAYRLPPLRASRLARMAEHLAWVAIPLAIIGVLVTRAQITEPMKGIVIIAAAATMAVSALAVAGVASIEIWKTGRVGLGAILRALIVSLVLLAYPGYLTVQALRLPRLNDISTDIEDAPAFSRSSAAFAARQGQIPLTLEPRQRQPQLRAYPDIRTLVLEIDAEDAFRLVKEAVQTLKWQIVEEAVPGGRSGQGRIEAIAESRLMRLREDIAIRIRPAGNETRIDIRSVSRLGRHDFGSNASRIRALVAEISANRD